jgi:acetoin utilization deacetylase AcuC-like enzyme
MHFTSGDDDESCERDKPGDKGVPIVYHPAYSKPVLPEGHRFPMPVFREIYKRLIRDGVAVPGANLYQPARMPSMEELLYAHDENYVDAFRHGALDETSMRKIGLPWSEALVERTLAEVAGTILTADLALATGLAVNCAGGTHHAHFDHGSGYCIFNDLAITAKRVIQRKAADRVLILDLDVHQGDGTARITSDDANVFALSVHCAENFPANKARSDRDVSLPKGTGDETYIKTVEGALRETLQDFKPNLVLYDAGVDVHEADKLGGLSLTDEGLIRREALVLDVCVGGGVPVAAFVGGGYDDDMDELVRRHCILHHVAREIYESNKM